MRTENSDARIEPSIDVDQDDGFGPPVDARMLGRMNKVLEMRERESSGPSQENEIPQKSVADMLSGALQGAGDATEPELVFDAFPSAGVEMRERESSGPSQENEPPQKSVADMLSDAFQDAGDATEPEPVFDDIEGFPSADEAGPKTDGQTAKPDTGSQVDNPAESGEVKEGEEAKEEVKEEAKEEVREEAPEAIAGQPATLGLGAAAICLGYQGVSGLVKAIGSGGRSIGNAVADYRLERDQRKLNESVAAAYESLEAIRSSGLSVLDNPKLSEKKRKQAIEDYKAIPDNKLKLDSLVKSIDDMGFAARRVVRRGMAAGMDADSAFQQGTAPVQQFMHQNQQILGTLDAQGRTLADRLNDILGGIIEMIKSLVARFTGGRIGEQPNSEQAAGKPAEHPGMRIG